MSYQEFRPRSFQTLPPVIKNLLIINILLFAATIVLKSRLGIDLVEILGLHYITASNFQPYQFITYMFMHGGFTHIFFNMFAVWMFGSVLENVWGAKRFLIYYIITGLGAALIQYVVFYMEITPVVTAVNAVQQNLTLESFENLVTSDTFMSSINYEFSFEYEKMRNLYNSVIHESPERALSIASQFLIQFKNYYLNAHVIIGASGSLFGILLAFGMMFPNTLLYLYFLVPIKAKWVVIGYGAIELILGFSNNPSDNVAHFAHLGGMLFGFIMIMFWKRKRDYFY
jgi:membrane associated rhomboid family serine protease